MSTLSVAAALALEAVFTAMFARSMAAGLAVVITFGALSALRRSGIVARYVLVPYVIVLAYCAWLCRSLAPVPFMLMLVAQQLQAFSWWLAPRPGDRHGTDDGATAAAVFVAAGFVTAYFALAGTAVPPPPVSRAMGTLILVFCILAMDIRRGELHRRTGLPVPLARMAVVATIAYLALQFAMPLAGPWVNATSSMLAKLEELLTRDSNGKPAKVVRVRRGSPPGIARGSGRWPRELIEDDDTPHVHLTVPDPQEARWLARRPVYLRVATHDTFGDNGWTNSVSTVERLRDGDDGIADNVISLRRATSATVTYNVYTRFHASGLMPLIPGATAVHLPAILRQAGDTFSSPLTENLFRFSYTATSAPKIWSEVAAESPEAASAADECLRVPNTELGARIAELAGYVEGPATDTGGVIGRLARHLRKRYTYTRGWPGTVDPESLDSFLFGGKAGNCQAFASALALGLRTCGIPSRVGLGYCAGEYDPDAGVYSFYADHAHAWTEVHLKDHGWVVVDATPPAFATLARHDPGSIDLSGFPGLASLMDKGILARDTGLYSLVSTAVLIFNIALLSIAVYLVLLARKRTGERGRAGSAPAVSSATPDFYRSFCRAFGRAGCPIRTGQTAREYLAVLKARGLLGDECDDIIRYLYAICYEESPRNAREEKRMKTRIRRAIETA